MMTRTRMSLCRLEMKAFAGWIMKAFAGWIMKAFAGFAAFADCM